MSFYSEARKMNTTITMKFVIQPHFCLGEASPAIQFFSFVFCCMLVFLSHLVMFMSPSGNCPERTNILTSPTGGAHYYKL